MAASKLIALSLLAASAVGAGSAAQAAGLPAARVGDPLSSPAGPPGQIQSPGATTVLIGGVPAARKGDLATCPQVHFTPYGPVYTFPPDPIVKGSATVLIGGLPAARVTDNTSLGCVINNGSTTVLVGG